MTFYGDMLRLQRELAEMGIPSTVPEADDECVARLAADEYEEFKRRASLKYLMMIKAPQTLAILVDNKDKHGIAGYIGPNTFAEIAVAFASHKQILLLHRTPDAYRDELMAWEAVSLDGRLEEIGRLYESAPCRLQMALFDDLP